MKDTGAVQQLLGDLSDGVLTGYPEFYLIFFHFLPFPFLFVLLSGERKST